MKEQALQAGDRAKGFFGARVFSLIASFAAPPGTAGEGGTDYVLGLQGDTSAPVARGQVLGPETPCFARVEKTGRHRSTKKAAPGK